MKLLRSIYLNQRLFAIAGAVVVLFLLAFPWPLLLPIAKVLFFVLLGMVVVDVLLLYRNKTGIYATRITPEMLSNGDENELKIYIENRYGFTAHLNVVDEIPFQFQKRDVDFELDVPRGETRNIVYHLRPTTRGEYNFGAVNVYVRNFLGLVSRRFQFDANKMVAVYPSYLQMRKYELMAIHNRLSDYGLKKIRRIGHSMEFEKIREYVTGDDYRTVNWKATSRKNALMVNQFQDEKSQHVYSVLDKGRLMKQPFAQMTLLDYAINSALVMANISIKKGDKAGLISFSEKMGSFLPADSRATQMNRIQEALYKEQTQFLDPSYELLTTTVIRKIPQRSLLLLYTNFETLGSMRRQLKYFRAIAQRQVLVVIFFENSELKDFIHQPSHNTEAIYQKTIAEKFIFEKRQIVKELKQHGIYSVLTTPEQLTVNTINKYLELKSRGII